MMAAASIKPRPGLTVRWFGAAVILAMIVGALVSIVALRGREIEDWRLQMNAMSLVLSEQTSTTLSIAYLALDEVTEHVLEAGAADSKQLRAKLSTPAATESLRRAIRGLPHIDLAAVVGADGNIVAFTYAYPVPAINVSDRDYFQALRDNPKQGDFISRPARSKANGKWNFFIARRLDDARGKFLGVVLIGMSVEAFTDFYEEVSRNLGEGASISLFRRDLTLLARWPHLDENMGKVNRSGSAHEVINVMGKKADVILRDTPRFTNREPDLRLAAVRALDRYPLVTVLVVTEDLFLANWRRSAALIAGATLVGVLTVLAGLFGLVRNLRRREADMAEMERLKTEAEAANLAKSKFLATMSHEIRTPMNGILGMAQLLMMPSLEDHERRDYARTILDSGQTLLTLLNDILDLSKVEAGKLNLVPAVFDPCRLIEETCALFGEPAQAKGLRIESAWRGPQGQRYRADPIRLRQMLTNLVSNAVKFTERGVVRLEAAEVGRQGNRALLEFAVADTGIGIPAGKQAQLFKPFSQMDSSTTREYGGTGLGLSIVRNLARLMDGEVGVDSDRGRGSRFWFRIRADIVGNGAEDCPGEQLLPAPGSGKGDAGRVLVVEDNAINRRVVEKLLGKLGFRAESVGDGRAAVEAITGGLRPDLVLMDVQMPVMDGCQATGLIRDWEQAGGQPRLPIIALTAGAFEDDRQQCVDAGMDDFLTKPIALAELAAMLAKWTGRAVARENAAENA